MLSHHIFVLKCVSWNCTHKHTHTHTHTHTHGYTYAEREKEREREISSLLIRSLKITRASDRRKFICDKLIVFIYLLHQSTIFIYVMTLPLTTWSLFFVILNGELYFPWRSGFHVCLCLANQHMQTAESSFGFIAPGIMQLCRIGATCPQDLYLT